jgi:hypothetical protein
MKITWAKDAKPELRYQFERLAYFALAKDNDLKFDEGVSYQAFVNEAVSKVKEDLFSSTLSKRLLRINKDDVMMAMLFFALALPLSLILAGSWKIILSR